MNTEHYNLNITPETHAKAVEKAKSEGFQVIVGGPRHLLLDIDSWENKAKFEEMYKLFRQFVVVVNRAEWKSKSKKGWHIVLYLEEEYSVTERIAMQAMLGSDPKKELFSMIGYENGVKEPSVLFKPINVVTPKPKRTPKRNRFNRSLTDVDAAFESTLED